MNRFNKTLFYGGVFTKLINKNTTIPTKASETFSTATDNQPAVTVHVLQGERSMAKDNKSLGQFNLTDIPPSPRGTPQIEVTLDIDANGILHVSAKDKNTGKENKITIKANSGLSDSEIKKMIRESEENIKDDQERLKVVTLRNEIDALSHQINKQGENSYANDIVKEAETVNNVDDLEHLKNKLVEILQKSQSESPETAGV